VQPAIQGDFAVNRVFVDDALRSKLDQFETETELCDKDGKVFGVFTPVNDPDRRWYEWAKGRYSDEELERRCNEPGEKTTAEVLDRLREA
jgi:hypothetical protein